MRHRREHDVQSLVGCPLLLQPLHACGVDEDMHEGIVMLFPAHSDCFHDEVFAARDTAGVRPTSTALNLCFDFSLSFFILSFLICHDFFQCESMSVAVILLF